MSTHNRESGSLAIVGMVIAGVVILAMGGVVAWKAMGPSESTAATTGETGESSEGTRVAGLEAARAVLSSAQTYMSQGEHGKAAGVLRGAVEQYPDDQDLRVAYGEVLVRIGDDPEAAYEQYVAALAIGPREGELEFAAGNVASQLGKNDRAIEHYWAAQTADASEPKYSLYLGQAQMEAGELNDAKANLMMATNIDEELAVAWGMLAEIALRENKLGIAQQHIRRARTLEPGVVAWRVIEARTLNRTGKPEQALMVLASLPVAERDSPPIVRLMASSYGLLNQPDEAAQIYAQASGRNPDNAELAFEAAVWAERVGDVESAKKLAKRGSMLGHEGAKEMLERLE